MENRTQLTMRVSRRSIAANVLLSVIKLLAGVLAALLVGFLYPVKETT